MRRHLCPSITANRVADAIDHKVVDPVLVRTGRRHTIKFREIALVFAKQPLAIFLAPGRGLPICQLRVPGQNLIAGQCQARFLAVGHPAPGVARPELRQYVQARRLISAVVHRDTHEDVVGRVFGVLHCYVEVSVVLEHTRVENLVLGVRQSTTGVFRDQVGVGKFGLRVFVEHAHVGMARYAIDMEIQLLDVFAVVAFGVVQAEQTFLENRVPLVPQPQSQTPVLSLVGEPRQPVLAPAISATAGMVVGKIAPGIAIGAVVLAHRAPLTFTQIRPPFAPGIGLAAEQTLAFDSALDVRSGFGGHGGSVGRETVAV
ncbi:hypothetical protein D3C72_313310 [compost metagenome]